jgi:Spy/CpxP family protein refolding chaperone
MKNRWMIGFVALLLTVPAWAQRGEGDEQPARQGGRPGRGGPGMGMGSPEDMARQLGETLNLTAEQKPKYDAIVEKFKPKWQEQANERAKMMDLVREMRDALQKGDEAKAEEIRKEIEDLREGSRALLTQFLDEVQPILTPEQVQKLDEFRERVERFRGGGGGLEPLLARVPDELKLTDAQRPKFNELAAKVRANLRELRTLRDEMRKAREGDNSARATELQKQIQEKRNTESVDAFLAQLEPILSDEQKAKLPDLWVRLGGGMGPNDARFVLRVAQRLELKPEQKTKLNQLAHDAMVASRAELTPEKHAEIAKSTKDKIVALLDPNQAKEFERLLERGTRMRPGGRGRPNP